MKDPNIQIFLSFFITTDWIAQNRNTYLKQNRSTKNYKKTGEIMKQNNQIHTRSQIASTISRNESTARNGQSQIHRIRTMNRLKKSKLMKNLQINLQFMFRINFTSEHPWLKLWNWGREREWNTEIEDSSRNSVYVSDYIERRGRWRP